MRHRRDTPKLHVCLGFKPKAFCVSIPSEAERCALGSRIICCWIHFQKLLCPRFVSNARSFLLLSHLKQ